jgi:hypothetical protein
MSFVLKIIKSIILIVPGIKLMNRFLTQCESTGRLIQSPIISMDTSLFGDNLAIESYLAGELDGCSWGTSRQMSLCMTLEQRQIMIGLWEGEMPVAEIIQIISQRFH